MGAVERFLRLMLSMILRDANFHIERNIGPRGTRGRTFCACVTLFVILLRAVPG